MKKKGAGDFPQMPMNFGNAYGMGMNPMGMMNQMPMMPQPMMGAGYGGDMRSAELRAAEERARTAELRAAEERARIAEERMNTRIESDLRLAEERIKTAEIRAAEERGRKTENAPASTTGMSAEMLAMFFAAMRGIGVNTPAYPQVQQPAIQPPAQQPQPILITNQQPAQPQDGRRVVPPGAVMTTTSTTTIDASKRQNPATGYSGYEDDYDYNVYERLDDKNN
jgi:hypothetical protein